MPNFGLKDKDVESIVMVLTSMVKDKVPLDMKERPILTSSKAAGWSPKRIARAATSLKGSAETFAWSCRTTCSGPPNLNTQGQKTQPEFLRSFLKDPGAVQPRCAGHAYANLPLHEHQVAAIGKYFARWTRWTGAGSMPKSKALRRTSPPASNSLKRVSVQNAIPRLSDQTPARTNRRGTKSDTGSQSACVRIGLPRWITSPGMIDPTTRMPDFFKKDEATGKRLPIVAEKANHR